ncbi:MAG: flagellar hook-associated protein 3 [Clostridium sp.]
MRITNGSMMNSYLREVQNNLQTMDKLNTQLNTTKQVNKISDDPLKTIKILNLNNEIEDVEKYNYNCDEITGWLDLTDEALGSISNLSSDIKTLLTSISGTFGKEEIKAVQTQVNEKIKQIGEAMNTTYAGKYIFGGSITDEAPVKIETDKDGNVALIVNNPGESKLDDKLNTVISSGITVDYNLTLNEITKTNGKETGSTSGLELLGELSKKLNEDPINMEAIGKLSKDLDGYMNDILNNRSIVGARTNTVEQVKDNNDNNILEMKGALSVTQDVNVTEKFIELKSAEMVYNASLQVSSKLFNTTILDYLR